MVRLGDTDVDGRLRLDGAARFLQDVATDDWTDTGVVSDDVWVVRRTALRLLDGATWPRYLERVGLTTWCGGVGAAWAERRTDLAVGGRRVIEAAALWVPTDSSGRPRRLPESFFRVYGESVKERKIPGRVDVPPVPESASRRSWPVRQADLDLIGHVNNAAVWQALTEVARPPLREVSVIHHHAVEANDDVTLVDAPGAMWLLVEGEVRVSARFVRV